MDNEFPPLSPEVTKIGDSILRTIGQPVTVFGEPLKAVFDKMYQMMVDAHGIGIAGQQVGLALRLTVISIKKDLNETCIYNGEEKRVSDVSPLYIANPEVYFRDGTQIVTEGCLSIPGVQCAIQRYEQIKVKFQDVDGKEVVITAHGLLSECMQHEFDHLDGVLYIDHMSEEDREALLERYEKLKSKASVEG